MDATQWDELMALLRPVSEYFARAVAHAEEDEQQHRLMAEVLPQLQAERRKADERAEAHYQANKEQHQKWTEALTTLRDTMQGAVDGLGTRLAALEAKAEPWRE